MNSFVDLYSLMLHRAVAEKMRHDQRRVLKIARANLERWLGSASFAHDPERRPLLEWKNILNTLSPDEISQLITSDTDEGQRLRSSSPFAGILTSEERKEVWNACAEVGLA